MSRGSLTVVGTGIQLAAHLTPEARAAIQQADEVLYLVGDPVTDSLIEDLNPRCRSLQSLCAAGGDRREAYTAMVDEILARVRAGLDVCAAFYGHPGVFVGPAHEAIRRAREEGFDATMLPGISAEDCLFADLGIDPGRTGCQSYEATDFLIRPRNVETSAVLILWQIGVIGETAYSATSDPSGLSVLIDRLRQLYPTEHETIVYEASPYPICKPLVRRVPLSELAGTEIPPLATLVVPPRRKARRDLRTITRLGLPPR